jgi:hypothetical protein
MAKVYPYLLHKLLGPLSADDDEEYFKYRSLDPNDSEQVKEVIRGRLLPSFQAADPVRQRLSKTTLMYYLTCHGGVNFECVFDSMLMPFEHPKDARDFFVWIWEIYFPKESYVLPHPERYIVDEDPSITYLLPREAEGESENEN